MSCTVCAADCTSQAGVRGYEVVHTGANGDGLRWALGRMPNRLIQNVASEQLCFEKCAEELEFECKGFVYKHSDDWNDSDGLKKDDCTLLNQLVPIDTAVPNITSARMIRN